MVKISLTYRVAGAGSMVICASCQPLPFTNAGSAGKTMLAGFSSSSSWIHRCGMRLDGIAVGIL